jgi:hypothetical protein
MATDFLEDPGTGGFIVTPFDLMTTELNALATTDTATSSVNGTSGVFTQTNYGNAEWAQIYFQSGGAFTPTAGGYLAGWFLFSANGTTFEITVANTALTRTPDFIISLNAAAYASGNQSPASGLTRVPNWSNKVFIQNNAGVTLPSTGNLIVAGPVGFQQ